jgi:hypothetical protein
MGSPPTVEYGKQRNSVEQGEEKRHRESLLGRETTRDPFAPQTKLFGLPLLYGKGISPPLKGIKKEEKLIWLHPGRRLPWKTQALGLNQARIADDDTVSITLTQLQHRGYDE